MRKLDNKVLDGLYLVYRWVSQVLDPLRLVMSFPGFVKYFRSLYEYKSKSSERLRFRDTYPIVWDATSVTPFDPHYFYQSVWASRKIRDLAPQLHVDVGSQLPFVSQLSVQTPVVFVDLRPVLADIPDFHPVRGTLLQLPFASDSLQSCSCLHVVEHIGLGRYGDPIDPDGSEKALKELERVVAPGGSLLLSTPIGKPRVCFNSHRIHSPGRIIDVLKGLDLVEFSAVDDRGHLRTGTSIQAFETAAYACGLFHFKKPAISI